jgi:hypothetical protein
MFGKLEDTRVIACGIAVGCMLVDDLPESQYNTFHDPGTAAMLSIVLANAFTLAGRLGWNWRIYLAFLFALFLKFFIQPFFWVENAWVWVIGTLLLAHALFGFLAAGKKSFEGKILMSIETVCSVVAAIIVTSLIGLCGSSWIIFYAQLAAVRILIPFAFWTAVRRFPILI